jgi:hypothetical protein
VTKERSIGRLNNAPVNGLLMRLPFHIQHSMIAAAKDAGRPEE